MKTMKASADGNCHFNSMSILKGDESASQMLRLLIIIAVEPFLNCEHYAKHPNIMRNIPNCPKLISILKLLYNKKLIIISKNKIWIVSFGFLLIF